MYYGSPTSRGVQNVPLNKVTDRARPVGVGRDVYLCHTVCAFGATRATDALRDVRDFLAAHPREVLLISIEDHIRPRDIARVFEHSGLERYVWRGRLGPRRFPTLREMIDKDERVVAMAENSTGGVPWLQDQFDLVQETPYRFGTPAEVAAESSCRPNRGNARNPLFLLNNWVDTSPLPAAEQCRRGQCAGHAAAARAHVRSGCAAGFRTWWRSTSTSRGTWWASWPSSTAEGRLLDGGVWSFPRNVVQMPVSMESAISPATASCIGPRGRAVACSLLFLAI